MEVLDFNERLLRLWPVFLMRFEQGYNIHDFKFLQETEVVDDEELLDIAAGWIKKSATAIGRSKAVRKALKIEYLRELKIYRRDQPNFSGTPFPQSHPHVPPPHYGIRTRNHEGISGLEPDDREFLNQRREGSWSGTTGLGERNRWGRSSTRLTPFSDYGIRGDNSSDLSPLLRPPLLPQLPPLLPPPLPSWLYLQPTTTNTPTNTTTSGHQGALGWGCERGSQEWDKGKPNGSNVDGPMSNSGKVSSSSLNRWVRSIFIWETTGGCYHG